MRGRKNQNILWAGDCMIIGRLSLFLPLWSDARAIDLNFVAANRNAEQTLVEQADFATDPLLRGKKNFRTFTLTT